jgi:hypothetical protein
MVVHTLERRSRQAEDPRVADLARRWQRTRDLRARDLIFDE